ncbi:MULTISPECIES: hypothetical protein [Luteimonas]|uniref:hypothetical protein n=1 Tax=Luteimonas TaxID=83614 RepID=UPI000C7BC64B|nr:MULTISPECIES: hypothetical protein [Luteimonas]
MPSPLPARVLSALLIGLLLPGAAVAQDAASPATAPEVEAAPAEWAPRTGDAWLDTWMTDVNRYGARYHDAFVDELVRYQGAPRVLVEELLVDERWRPADVYLACATAVAIGRPCRGVASAFRRDQASGWSGVLTQLEVTPDAAPFQRIKVGLVSSYARWARPITLDAGLRQALSDRER